MCVHARALIAAVAAAHPAEQSAERCGATSREKKEIGAERSRVRCRGGSDKERESEEKKIERERQRERARAGARV